MASESDKPLTPYQLSKLTKESRESWCGLIHDSIEEAIVHAEENLGMRHKKADEYWGTTKYSDSLVVGWKVNERKRYRLDHTPNFAKENADAAKWAGTSELKGRRGVHVNEENFDDPAHSGRTRICHPTLSSLIRAETYWRKWTKKFGTRP